MFPLDWASINDRASSSARLTIVANVAIATGPALLGAPGSSVMNLIYSIIEEFFQSKISVFCKICHK